MVALQKEMQQYKYVKIPEVPTFTGEYPRIPLCAIPPKSIIIGGAIGYVSYDCIHYFEPKTKRDLADPLNIPESIFMLCDTVIVFDHLYQNVKVVSHVYFPSSPSASTSSALPATNAAPNSLPFVYATAVSKARRAAKLVLSSTLPSVIQPPIKELGVTPTSNVGKEGYEGFVTKLKEHIIKGDIIQAVPSQRLSKPTALHPFNAYRKLRQTNPSPYMFFVDCGDLQLVGASPETLCKVEQNTVYNHAIAGTVKRGATPEGGSIFPLALPIYLFSNN